MSPNSEIANTIKFYTSAVISYITVAIPWAFALDWLSKCVSTIIAIALFLYARNKYRQDMKNKKLDELIKTKMLENLHQQEYQLIAKNKLLSTINKQTEEAEEDDFR